jgi:hypothetical protein
MAQAAVQTILHAHGILMVRVKKKDAGIIKIKQLVNHMLKTKSASGIQLTNTVKNMVAGTTMLKQTAQLFLVATGFHQEAVAGAKRQAAGTIGIQRLARTLHCILP